MYISVVSSCSTSGDRSNSVRVTLVLTTERTGTRPPQPTPPDMTADYDTLMKLGNCYDIDASGRGSDATLQCRSRRHAQLISDGSFFSDTCLETSGRCCSGCQDLVITPGEMPRSRTLSRGERRTLAQAGFIKLPAVIPDRVVLRKLEGMMW